MADRWIVSSYVFHQHESLEVATREAERLAKKTGKVMHIHRVKTTLQRSDAMAIIERLNARVKELEATYETDMRPTFAVTESVGEVSQKIELDIGEAFASLQESPELCAAMIEMVAPLVGKELNAAHTRIAELEAQLAGNVPPSKEASSDKPCACFPNWPKLYGRDTIDMAPCAWLPLGVGSGRCA